jgi:hypothetical protein
MSLRNLFIFSLFLIPIGPACAQDAKSPLRFVPGQTELVLKIDHPRLLVETVEKHELFQKGIKLAGVRDLYDTTNFQQLLQLIDYFEKKLGKGRDDIIDDLSSGGIVVCAKLSPPQHTVLVLQAKNEKVLGRFVDEALGIATKELERLEVKDRIVRSKHHGHDFGKIGKKFAFAIADGALIIGSEEQAVKSALDLLPTENAVAKTILDNQHFVDALKRAPAKALVWAWLNLEETRKNEDFKNGLEAAALDPGQLILFGGLIDLLKRSPYVTATATRDGEGFSLAHRHAARP